MTTRERLDALDRITDGLLERLEENTRRIDAARAAGDAAELEAAMIEGFAFNRELVDLRLRLEGSSREARIAIGDGEMSPRNQAGSEIVAEIAWQRWRSLNGEPHPSTAPTAQELTRRLALAVATNQAATALEAKAGRFDDFDRLLRNIETARADDVRRLAIRELVGIEIALASCDRTPCPPCDRRREYRRTLEFYRDHPSEPIPDGYLRHDPDELQPATERTDP
ncbi:MAG: hypothetical protein HYV07_04645 [Deltaproteobacteria bacterium]|nr:hypothetical protein [Deltaproteobacteria bacterium]